jgi:anaerobic ribonucleoside-triphosphate reductase activating protein
MEDSDDCWPEDPDVLHIAHRADRCAVLGPGTRAVIWVQGCKLRCPSCIAPHSLPFHGGYIVGVEELARDLAALPIDGVTISGGEPFEQALALCRLIRSTRIRRDVSFLCYTGYDFEHLQRHGTPAQLELITELDLLIDGPYVEGQHEEDLWRGSANQRIHFLSDRHTRGILDRASDAPMIEATVTSDGSLFWMGIPPRGFTRDLLSRLAAQGITFEHRGAYDE